MANEELFNIPVGANTEQFDRDIEKAVKSATKNQVKVNVLPDVRGGGGNQEDSSRIQSAAKTAVRASTEYTNSISGALSEVSSGRIQGLYQNTISGIYKMGESFTNRSKSMYEAIRGVSGDVNNLPPVQPKKVNISEDEISSSISQVAESIKNTSEAIPNISSSPKPTSMMASFKDSDSDSKSSGGGGGMKISANSVTVKGNSVTVTGKINLPNVQGSASSTAVPEIASTNKEVKLMSAKVDKSIKSSSKGESSKARSTKSENPKTSKIGKIGNKLRGDMNPDSVISPIIDVGSDLAKAGTEVANSIVEGLTDIFDLFGGDKIKKIGKWLGVGGKVFKVGAEALSATAVASLGAMGAAVGIVSYLGGRYREQIVKQDSTIGATGRWVTGGGSYFRNEQVAEANVSLGRQTGEKVYGRSAMVTGEEIKFSAAMGTPISQLAEVLGSMRKEGNKPMSLAMMRGFANALGYTNMRQMEFIQLLSQQISKERQQGVAKSQGKEFLQYMMGVRGTQELKFGAASKLSEMGKGGLFSDDTFGLLMFAKGMEKYGSIAESELKLSDPKEQIGLFNDVKKELFGDKPLKRGTEEFNSAYTQLKVLAPNLSPNEILGILTGDQSRMGRVTPQTKTQAGSVPGAALSNREEGLYLNETGRQAFELALKIEQTLMGTVKQHSDAFGTVIGVLDSTIEGIANLLLSQKQDREDASKNQEATQVLIKQNANLLDEIATRQNIKTQILENKLNQLEYKVQATSATTPDLITDKYGRPVSGDEVRRLYRDVDRETDQTIIEMGKTKSGKNSLRQGPIRALIDALHDLGSLLESIMPRV